MKEETGIVFGHREKATGKELFVLHVLFKEIAALTIGEDETVQFDLPPEVVGVADSIREGVLKLYSAVPNEHAGFNMSVHDSIKVLVHSKSNWGEKRIVAYWSEQFVLGQTLESWARTARASREQELKAGLRKKRADLDAFETRLHNLLDEMEEGTMYHSIPF